MKLLGCTIGYKSLCTKPKELWRLTSDFKATDLDNSFYLIQLSCEIDIWSQNFAWIIFGKELSMKVSLKFVSCSMVGHYSMLCPSKPHNEGESSKHMEHVVQTKVSNGDNVPMQSLPFKANQYRPWMIAKQRVHSNRKKQTKIMVKTKMQLL